MSEVAEPSKGCIQATAQAGLRAMAEALFPVNEIGAPDYRDAAIVARTLTYMEELPPAQRRLLVFLFVFVELLAPLLVPCMRRFSSLPVEERTAAIRRWRSSRMVAYRYLGDGIKATLTMMYMSHPAVLSHVGAFKTCSNPHDPLQLEVRTEVLAAPSAAEASS